MARFAFLILALLALPAAMPALAKDAHPAAPAVPALPEPLTKESIRELVSRLSDDEVRKLLLDQLDRTAAHSAPAAKPAMGMSGVVGEHAGSMRTTLGSLEAAYYALPDTMRKVSTKFSEGDGASALGALLGHLLLLLAIGFAVEWLYRRALRRVRARIKEAPASTFTASIFRYGVLLLIELSAVLVWTIAAITAFFLVWHEHEFRRAIILDILLGLIIVRTTAAFSRFLLAPRESAERLLPFDDATARVLYRFPIVVATLFAILLGFVSVLRGAGADNDTLELVAVAPLAIGIAYMIWIVWRVRLPIAKLIRGDGEHHPVRHWLAELWPILATAYFGAVLFARVFDVLAGEQVLSGQGVFSVLIVVALPIVDMWLCRALAAAAHAEVDGTKARVHSFLAEYESVFRRAIHIITTVTALLLFARLWGINVFELAQNSMGGRISSSLLGICIVLLLAYMIWEAAKTAIDRKLAAEEAFDPEHPASRLRTVLPLLRALILVTIFVMATMSTLAALGVDILPLLAGASVVGVAIGFGSQTLVRDIVSGAFFLMDDAFRLGEYIEVGDAKGRVEKINVRSLFLRHHRGAINILPYGEIKRLRNTSRDWMIMVLDFRVTYDTNLATVKKILKDIGAELASDEELAPDLLQPLKFAGVQSTEDSAIVVRAKFTARPEGEPYMIRKTAYQKILKAFRDNGIKFAHRQVTVNVPPGYRDDDAVVRAGGSAALIDATPPRSATG